MAVAGLGAIGRLHASNAAALSSAELALVVDQDPALAEATGAALAAPWSRSFEDALADPSVEAVVIATPTPLHADMVGRAAEAGKHVLCEKPLSLTPDDGRAATVAAREAGRVLQVGFQRRYDPDFVAAKRMIDAGELGRIRLLRIAHRNRTPPHEGDLTGRLGSPFVDMTIHDFDTARWLVGEIEEVSGFEGAGAAAVVARFETGALALIDNTRAAAYGFECSAELMGERSTVRIGWASAPAAADHIERHRTAYADELRDFARCVRTGAAPRVGGEDATAALELSLAAERCVA